MSSTHKGQGPGAAKRTTGRLPTLKHPAKRVVADVPQKTAPSRSAAAAPSHESDAAGRSARGHRRWRRRHRNGGGSEDRARSRGLQRQDEAPGPRRGGSRGRSGAGQDAGQAPGRLLEDQVPARRRPTCLPPKAGAEAQGDMRASDKRVAGRVPSSGRSSLAANGGGVPRDGAPPITPDRSLLSGQIPISPADLAAQVAAAREALAAIDLDALAAQLGQLAAGLPATSGELQAWLPGALSQVGSLSPDLLASLTDLQTCLQQGAQSTGALRGAAQRAADSFRDLQDRPGRGCRRECGLPARRDGSPAVAVHAWRHPQPSHGVARGYRPPSRRDRGCPKGGCRRPERGDGHRPDAGRPAAGAPGCTSGCGGSRRAECRVGGLAAAGSGHVARSLVRPEWGGSRYRAGSALRSGGAAGPGSCRTGRSSGAARSPTRSPPADLGHPAPGFANSLTKESLRQGSVSAGLRIDF